MKVIRRKRNSGKTTILLHHMEVNPWTVMVCRTEDTCTLKTQRVEELGLRHVQKDRFYSLARMNEIPERCKVLVDDADQCCRRHPMLGYEAVGKAHVITITEE